MYEQYWRLQRPAFDNDFDPRFYFPARSHHGALLKLRYCLENRKDAAVLVGDHGLGKTYLTHLLEHELDAERFAFARVVFPLLSPAELLRYLAYRLGTPCESATAPTDAVLAHLENHLKREQSTGRRPVVLVDDAHLLDIAHLQTLQLLLNLGGGGPGFGLVLAGRSDLLARLKRVPPLAERVAVRMTLQPLGEDEAAGYVAKRLQAAGRADVVLHAAAIQSAWELSRGVPRVMNQICDLSLLVGYADGLTGLTAVEVQAAAAELGSVTAD
jgi:general secretion pathway protein A